MQYINVALTSAMGSKSEHFPAQSKEQRTAASVFAEELAKCIPSISLSIDKRVTPTGATDKDKQGALLITIGPLLFGSP